MELETFSWQVLSIYIMKIKLHRKYKLHTQRIHVRVINHIQDIKQYNKCINDDGLKKNVCFY